MYHWTILPFYNSGRNDTQHTEKGIAQHDYYKPNVKEVNKVVESKEEAQVSKLDRIKQSLDSKIQKLQDADKSLVRLAKNKLNYSNRLKNHDFNEILRLLNNPDYFEFKINIKDIKPINRIYKNKW